MRQIELQADQALAQGLQLPYAMIRSYSQVTMGNTPTAVDLTEVIEARFFNAETEVRLFRKDGKRGRHLQYHAVQKCKGAG